MSSRFRDVAFALVAGAAIALPAAGAERTLRVCADPENLPYSARDGSGFENRIAKVIAEDLHAQLEFTWTPLQRGFVRKTLGAGLCDILIGVPVGFEPVLTTRPYYRSAYVLVRKAGERAPVSFNDPVLRTARIGVPLVGDDGAATPPGYALASLGIVDNVAGYALYGSVPQAQRLVSAVASGELEYALVWGPQAAYYAREQPATVSLTYLPPPAGLAVPFEFGIAIGVARRNTALRDELDAAIARREEQIDSVLRDYAVPQVGATEMKTSRPHQ